MSLEDIDDDDDCYPCQEESSTFGHADSPMEDRDAEDNAEDPTCILLKDQLLTDWYEVLKVPPSATASEIKNAYHKRCLETHPDKVGMLVGDTQFKEVVKAFAILGKPETRRVYDSAAPFDDTIPDNAKLDAEEFFKVYNPVFVRNQRWSMKPMPSLGDMTTDLEEVEAFYKAWNSFRSWRDFSNQLEPPEDLEGECREIRRRVQYERTRQLEKYKQKEIKRVSNLVEQAYRHDPRIRERILQERAEKLLQKQKREDERNSIQERKRKEEEDAAREEEEKIKQEKKAQAQNKRELRASILQVLRTYACIDDSQLESLTLEKECVRTACLKWLLANATNLKTLKDEIENLDSADCKSELVQCINRTIEETEKEKSIDRYGKHLQVSSESGSPSASPSRTTETSGSKDIGEWSATDFIALQKAIAKFPGGTMDRWEKMSQMMQTHTPKQILLKTKEVENSWDVMKVVHDAAVELPLDPTVWNPAQQRQLEGALRNLKDYKEKDKWEKTAACVDGKTKADCIARYKFLSSQKRK